MNTQTLTQPTTSERTLAIAFARFTAECLWSHYQGMWYQYNDEDNPVTGDKLFEIFYSSEYNPFL